MTPPLPLSCEVETFVSAVWSEVDRFLNETGMGPTMFSRAAVNDPNLIRHIHLGRRSLTFNMAVRLKTYMDAWPKEDGPRVYQQHCDLKKQAGGKSL